MLEDYLIRTSIATLPLMQAASDFDLFSGALYARETYLSHKITASWSKYGPASEHSCAYTPKLESGLVEVLVCPGHAQLYFGISVKSFLCEAVHLILLVMLAASCIRLALWRCIVLASTIDCSSMRCWREPGATRVPEDVFALVPSDVLRGVVVKTDLDWFASGVLLLWRKIDILCRMTALKPLEALLGCASCSKVSALFWSSSP